jgi:hypothetical protein
VIGGSGCRAKIALGTLVAVSVTTAVACSVSISGSETAADAGNDAMGSDAASPEANPPDVRNDTELGDVVLPDASDAGDGSADAACTGVTCNGQCTSASDCSGCSGATLLCAPQHACVSACGACRDSADASMPIECFACDAKHQNPIGTCAPDDAGTYCLNGGYFGSYHGGAGYHCGCAAGDAGAETCPGASQVCATINNAPICVTCGEPVPTDITGMACKAPGTTCNPSAHACR